MTPPPSHPRAEPPRTDEVASLDAASLKALAHPLRVTLLGALRLDGPATASQLAARFGENSGATSYHLRQLAGAGFVEEAAELGTGRERYWRARHRLTELDDRRFEGDTVSQERLTWLLHDIVSRQERWTHRWIDRRSELAQYWGEQPGMSDHLFHATPQQLRDLAEEVWEVIQRHVDAAEAAGDAGADAGADATADDVRDARPAVVLFRAFPLEEDL